LLSGSVPGPSCTARGRRPAESDRTPGGPRRASEQASLEVVVRPRAADDLAPLVVPVDQLSEHVSSTSEPVDGWAHQERALSQALAQPNSENHFRKSGAKRSPRQAGQGARVEVVPVRGRRTPPRLLFWAAARRRQVARGTTLPR